jgi:hypothetical protein
MLQRPAVDHSTDSRKMITQSGCQTAVAGAVAHEAAAWVDAATAPYSVGTSSPPSTEQIGTISLCTLKTRLCMLQEKGKIT